MIEFDGVFYFYWNGQVLGWFFDVVCLCIIVQEKVMFEN